MIIYAILHFLISISGLGSPVEPELENFIMHQDYFYASAPDTYEIVKLNKQGNIVERMGQRGRGPGEFATGHLKMAFVGDTLFAYDMKNHRLTLLNEDLSIIEERFPEEKISALFSFNNKPYGFYLKLPSGAEDKDRNVKNFQKAIQRSTYDIKPLDRKERVLATYTPQMMTTPVYRIHKVRSGNVFFGIYQPHQYTFHVYRDGSLQEVSLPTAESKTLGRKLSIEAPRVKRLYKDHPYSPTYELIRNMIIVNNNKIVIQIQSYKKGEQILFFDTVSGEVTQRLTSPKGRLIGKDKGYFYFYEDREITKYAMADMLNCSSANITFYISSFKQQCSSCKNSFFELYEWVRDQNIPFQLKVPNNNWFSNPSQDDYRDIIQQMNRWNVWGAVDITDECDDCFEGGLNMRVNDGALFSLPAPISELRPKIPCVN